MKLLTSVVPLLIASAHCLPTKQLDGNGLIVHTTSGTIYGRIDPASANVRQFLGIPYAQPPVGDLRFAPPEPLDDTAASSNVHAVDLPPSCPQAFGNLSTIYSRYVLEFNLQGLNKTGAISEDCLTLSVWAPTISVATKEPLPVVIYIYGGGFGGGGEDVPYQIPTKWVQRTQDHIVVTLNYRVNIFGFPNAAGTVSSSPNVGLLDQRLAVEWVRDNIAAFGGDASRMLLWGQSAGASSVIYYNYAYWEDPIVSALAMDSGVAKDVTENPDTSNFTFVASQFGCGNLNSGAELECMRQVPFHNITSYLESYSDAGLRPSLSFQPVPDNHTVYANLTERALAGKLARVPAIIGTNSGEGGPFLVSNTSPPDLRLNVTEFARLNTFFCPAAHNIWLRQQAGLDVFSYYYGGNFSNISPVWWLGAYHSSELPLIFGTYGDYRGPSTETEVETSHAMQNAWTAFAANGSYGIEQTGWKKYTKLGDKTVRAFGNDTLGVVAADISMGWSEAGCVGDSARLDL